MEVDVDKSVEMTETTTTTTTMTTTMTTMTTTTSLPPPFSDDGIADVADVDDDGMETMVTPDVSSPLARNGVADEAIMTADLSSSDPTAVDSTTHHHHQQQPQPPQPQQQRKLTCIHHLPQEVLEHIFGMVSPYRDYKVSLPPALLCLFSFQQQ